MSLLLLLSHSQSKYTKGAYPTLPSTDGDLAIAYTNTEYTDVSTDDGVYVGVAGQPYLLHQFKYQASNNTSAITLTWNGKSTIAPTIRPVYLQAWNYNTSAWETVASNNTANASTDFTLTGSKSTSLSNYYSASNVVTARVYQ